METGIITLSSGNSYAVDPLAPYEAIAWSNRVLAVLGPVLFSAGESGSGARGFSLDDKAATQIMRDAIARCWTPKNEKLSDPAVFNSWFQEHPGDLYVLGIKACMEVARDFFPGPLRTLLESVMNFGRTEESPQASRNTGSRSRPR